MMHRFTIDILADAKAIAAHIVAARPSSRMAHRFYRKGRRDGRRRRPTTAVAAFIQNAIELAMSKITEEYLAEDLELSVRLRSLEAELASVEADLSNSDAPPRVEPTSGLGASATRLLEVRHQRATAAAEGARQRKIQQVMSLRQRIAETVERRARLHDVTMQRLDSCRQTGQLLWTRYLTGFDLGRAKRGAPDDDAPGHSTALEFEIPPSFAVVAAGGE